MGEYVIERLALEDYHKCSNIWDMHADELTERFRAEIESGNRIVYVCRLNGEFVGEIAYVLDTKDPDYTIANRRIYLSRLIVKKELRGRGIGGMLIDFILQKVREMGYVEATIGVDKDNLAALRLYRKKGFDTVIYDGADEYGAYYKLMRKI